MIVRLIISPEAENDLLDAYRWYENKRMGLGSGFMKSIEASLNALQRYPKAYPVIYKNIQRVLIRRFPYGIFYIFDNETVYIIAVFHIKQEPKRLFKSIDVRTAL
ncbi:type II toxin-antitoxin system RelE/ParE family toxin [Candidatus Magnetobacterium casense]|uniref:type II toxin-antitoxin system RelE/ParE family toxin n=1 Tax=Candidatus Magnetobacterium casense TaxID=1455061 RepID=UPI000590C9E1